jgi:hypothetical protein
MTTSTTSAVLIWETQYMHRFNLHTQEMHTKNLNWKGFRDTTVLLKLDWGWTIRPKTNQEQTVFCSSLTRKNCPRILILCGKTVKFEYFCQLEFIFKMISGLNQGTRRVLLMKKNRGWKSRASAPCRNTKKLEFTLKAQSFRWLAWPVLLWFFGHPLRKFILYLHKTIWKSSQWLPDWLYLTTLR